MEKYDYRRVITDEIKDWIVNESDIPERGIMDGRDDDLYNWIEEEVFEIDEITGNGPNYFDTEEKCFEYIAGNTGLLYEAAHSYNIDNDIEPIIDHFQDKSLARYFDCTIRCYLLMDCIYQAVEELMQDGTIPYLGEYRVELDEDE